MKKNKDQTLKDLQELFERIPQVRAAGRDSSEFHLWREESQVVVRHAFGEHSDQLRKFNKVGFSPMGYVGYSGAPRPDFQQPFEQGLAAAAVKLKAMIIEVTKYWPNDDAGLAAPTDVLDTSNGNVFVIHGHDEAATQQLARFLERLELIPVILREEASKGKTIIEKFDEYAAVSYAVALLTADDVGSRRHESAAKPRARQNVIFELGYFIGRHGRNRVCALTKGEPEIPSDYAGVVYIPMDSGEWKIDLAKELDEAGFDIDMNKLKQ